jgi:predicted Zn finger-like uncharacterized protein
LKVIECPNCQSKFKVGDAVLQREKVKLRCSVCAHVFTYETKAELSLEQEFESLLSSDSKKPLAEDFELEETEIKETPDIHEVESKIGPLGVPFKEPEAQPESVIREIDSILGAGEEVGTYRTIELPPEEAQPARRYWIWGVLVLLVVLLGLGGYFFKDIMHTFQHARETAPDLERGPFFAIPSDGITYEIVNNRTEGTTLVVKGLAQKLVKRPLKSLLIEVRVYDQNKNILATKTTYAGILPDQEEFIANRQVDIDALLTAEPQSLGALSMADEIPFAVAFFGKTAQEGVSFQVEVKEYRWQ